MTKCELPNKLIADYIQSKQASEFQLNAISAKSSETRASLNAILEESTGYIISLNAVLAEPIESIRPSVIKLDSNEFLVSTDEGPMMRVWRQVSAINQVISRWWNCQ